MTTYNCPNCTVGVLEHPTPKDFDEPNQAVFSCPACGSWFSRGKIVGKSISEDVFVLEESSPADVDQIGLLEGNDMPTVLVADNALIPSVKALRWIVENKMAMKLIYPHEKSDGVLVDVITARMLIGFWDFMKNKADETPTPNMRKFNHMLTVSSVLLVKLVDMCWKTYDKNNEKRSV